MLISLNNAVRGSKVSATNGGIGTIHDALFNGVLMNLRYLIVDTGAWLPGRKVLVSPSVVAHPAWSERTVNVNLTVEEVKDSPGIDTEKPVSRQMEEKLAHHFRWPIYWGGRTAVRVMAQPRGTDGSSTTAISSAEDELVGEAPRLRSVSEVVGYRLVASDGEMGQVEDFILDDQAWAVRYMVVNIGDWLPGMSVIVSAESLETIRWSEQTVSVGLPRDTIKISPAFDPAVPVNRQYEERLYDFYGRERCLTG